MGRNCAKKYNACKMAFVPAGAPNAGRAVEQLQHEVAFNSAGVEGHLVAQRTDVREDADLRTDAASVRAVNAPACLVVRVQLWRFRPMEKRGTGSRSGQLDLQVAPAAGRCQSRGLVA